MAGRILNFSISPFGGKRASCPSFQLTTCRPSTCGSSPRVHSGHPPHEDRASNLVGPVRDVIGLVGWRRLFLAVRHIGRKWATCTPSVPPEALMDPADPWGTLGAHVVEAKGARGARIGGGVTV